MRIFLYIFMVLLLFPGVTFSESQDIYMEDIHGDKHLLSEYTGKGKWVVVNIWATSCPYCVHELDVLTEFYAQRHEKNAIILGLTLDWPGFGYPDKDYLRNFALDYFIDYPLFLVDRELANKIIGKSVDMIPLTFFYNPEGKLVYRLNGVVTSKILEDVVSNKYSHYKVEWAEEFPPEFKPE